MKRKIKILSLVLCCFLLCFSVAGCSLQDLFGGGYKSAYQVAVDNGYTGTEEEWLNTFRNGERGLSAYDIAVQNGFVGTEVEWLESLTTNDESVTNATNLSMRSSVKVVASKTVGDKIKLSNGAGTIISYNSSTHVAHILTCYHVIVDTTNSPKYCHNNVGIYFYGAESDSHFAHAATFLGGAIWADVAFLKVSIDEETWNKYHLKVASFNVNEPILGNKVIAIGNSNGKNLNAVVANISKQVEESAVANIDGTEGKTHLRVQRVNALLAHGNSGGGLFDTNAKLVGMVNAKSSDEEELNFSYAIPSSTIVAIYENITNQISGSTTWAMANKYKLGLDLTIIDMYTDIDEKGYLYPRDTVVIESASVPLGTLDISHDTLQSVTIKRGGSTYKSANINNVYTLGEMMWYVKAGDTVVIRYKDVSADVYKDIEIVPISTISNAEWYSTYSVDLTKC